MRIVTYIGLALATAMLFVQCGKEGEGPDLIEDEDNGWSHWDTGDVFYGKNDWTEVIVGDIPLVLSAPHGGDIRIDGVQLRNSCYPPAQVSVGTDSYTRELTQELGAYFLETYGVQPYVVINHLHRSNVDQNRDHINSGGDAYCPGEELMEEAWYDFHNYIDTALWRAVEKHGYALYIDMHAHGRQEPHLQRLEIGYMLTGNQLQQIANGTGNPGTLRQRSSIVHALGMKQELNFEDLIMGANAFGTLMANEDVPSVPSQQIRHPGGAAFFSGGYNTGRYTRDPNHPKVYGFQIEHHSGVRGTAAIRRAYIEPLSKVILDYMEFTRPSGTESIETK